MTAPSLLILGADAVLAAKPATPVQLAHACLAAGFQAIIPATWGDELIAGEILDRMREADGPRVQCSCPLVARRLSANADTIAHMLLSVVSPPVATARYLRAVYAPNPIHLTFAGACPSATNEAIDEWLTPDSLLKTLEERGIAARLQPTEFDSVLPPDRRRFYSEPGGVPSPAALRNLRLPVELREIGGEDHITELAQHLLSTTRTLLDVAPALGCSCSGVLQRRVLPAVARQSVRELEPPRAMAPVVEHSQKLSLSHPLPESPEPSHAPSAPLEVEERFASPPIPPSRPADLPEVSESTEELVRVAIEVSPRRSPVGTPRPVVGVTPSARVEAGRQLPRAYVARRRSSPRGVRTIPPKGSDLNRPDRLPRLALVIAGGLAGGLALGWLLSVLL